MWGISYIMRSVSNNWVGRGSARTGGGRLRCSVLARAFLVLQNQIARARTAFSSAFRKRFISIAQIGRDFLF
ncbi:hypothetical protein L596_008818 [Steinernema carpocapsae]|uniref:Uncharacterized protein n=1 Tax=Steinernema carpocapsae TaxID=34508 RepID=A0A4U5PDK6_STECR|nr:hypothetical protein L596_008818 [Steinernema carpocapsae]